MSSRRTRRRIDTIGYDPRSRLRRDVLAPDPRTDRPAPPAPPRRPASNATSARSSSRSRRRRRRSGSASASGTSSPIVRTLTRLEQFDLACSDGRGTVAVRRSLPPVQKRHVRRLPAAPAGGSRRVGRSPTRRAAARHGPPTRPPPRADAPRAGRRPRRRRTRLFSCGFHPAVCHDATRWAWERHCEAAREAGLLPAPSP